MTARELSNPRIDNVLPICLRGAASCSSVSVERDLRRGRTDPARLSRREFFAQRRGRGMNRFALGDRQRVLPAAPAQSLRRVA